MPKQRCGFARAGVPRSAYLMLVHFSLRAVLFLSALRPVTQSRAKSCFADVTEVVLVGAKCL